MSYSFATSGHPPMLEGAFASFFENSLDAMFLCEETSLLDCNEAALHLFGHKNKGSLLGISFVDLSPPLQPDGTNSQHAFDAWLVKANRERTARFEWQCFKADGQTLSVEFTFTTLDVAGKQLLHALCRDLTEVKRLEMARQVSKANCRSIFDATSDMIFVLNESGEQIVDVNQKACDWLGKSVEELCGLTLESVLQRGTLSDSEPVGRFLQRLFDNPAQKLEWCHHNSKTGTQWFEMGVSPIVIDAQPCRLVTAQDVTPRKEKEALLTERAQQARRFQSALVELAKSESPDLETRLQRITQADACTLDVARVSVWFFDSSFSQIECRCLYESRTGRYSQGNTLKADDFPRYFASLNEKRVIAASEARSHPDTSEFSDSYLTPLGIFSMLDVPIWRHGRMVGIVCHEHIGASRTWTIEEQDFAASVSDMVALAIEADERSRSLVALQESVLSYRSLFDNTQDCLYILNRDGVLIDVNPAVTATYGYSRREILGQKLMLTADAEHNGGESDVSTYIEKAFAGEPQQFEWWARHKDGHLLPREVSMARMSYFGEQALLVIGRDISERKWAEEALQNAHTSLSQTHQELQLAHDELEKRVEERTLELATANSALWAENSERLRAESELRRKTSELEAIIEASPDLYFQLDSQGHVLAYHAAVSSNLYVPPEVFLRKKIQDVLPPDVGAKVANGLEELARTQKVVYLEYELPLGDGPGLFEARLLPLLDERVIAIVRDITARRQAETTLRESEALKTSILEAALDAIITIDAEGHVIEFNPGAESIFGYDRNEVLGRELAELIVPERLRAEHRKGLKSYIAANQDIWEQSGELPAKRLRRHLGVNQGPVVNRRIEVLAIRADGVEFPIELAVSPILAVGRPMFTSYIRDISERKQAEESLRLAKDEAERAREAAERANRAKSEFLSRMSHELRTPMNSILGFGQILSRKVAPEQQRSVEHILKAGRHLLNMINEVLDIARIESNRIQLSLEPVRVCLIVQETVALIQPQATERDCSIVNTIPEHCDVFVLADRQRLMQVLLNLASNAVKYNRDGGTITLSCEMVKETCLRINVMDTGLGLTPEQMARVFSPFDRLGAEQSHIEGTGLGLALSKGFVEVMGGRMGVESEAGAGSNFWIELALAESPQQRLERTRKTVVSPSDGTPEQAYKVLYIEDNGDNLSLIEALLAERKEFTLLSAMQGQLGLEMARQHNPDVVLLDLHLPDMTGDEVLERLRQDSRTQSIPVIVISADAITSHRQKIIEVGAQEYLTKPLDIDQFFVTLDAVIEHSRATPTPRAVD